MYKQLSRGPSREIAGHVCLSCRRHLYVRRQLYVAQQRRHQGHVTAAQNGGGVDDWMDNFNDLSAESSSAKLADKPHREDKPRRDVNDWKSEGFEDLKKRLHEEKDGKNLDGVRQAPKARDSGSQRRRGRRELRNNARLIEYNKEDSRLQIEGNSWAAGRTRSNDRTVHAGKPVQGEGSAQVSADDRALQEEHASSQQSTVASGLQDLQASAERQLFEQVLASIDVTPSPMSSSEDIPPDPPPDFISSATESESRQESAGPLFRKYESTSRDTFTIRKQPSEHTGVFKAIALLRKRSEQAAVDDVSPPPGQVSLSADIPPPPRDLVATGEAFGPHAAVHSLLTPQQPYPRTRRSQQSQKASPSKPDPNTIVNSLASKARQVRDRPKWGGLRITPHQPATLKPSFDTLREADQVSPPAATPATASAAKPWGLRAAANGAPGLTSNVAGGAGGLGGSGDGDGRWDGKGSGRGVGGEGANGDGDGPKKAKGRFGFGFNKLKAMLYGEAGAEKGAEDVAPTKPGFAAETTQEGGAAQTTTGTTSDSPPAKNAETASVEQDGPSYRLSKLYAAQQERNKGHGKESTTMPMDDASVQATRSTDQVGGEGEVSYEAVNEADETGAVADSEPANARQSSLFRRATGKWMNSPQKRRVKRRMEREKLAAGKKLLDASAEKTHTSALGDTEPSAPVESQVSATETGRPLWEVMQGKQFAEAVSESTSKPAPASSAVVDAKEEPAEEAEDSATVGGIIDAKELQVTALNVPQSPVPGLAYGLDRVLFNPGVYQLQDPHSRVYNFDNYLQDIMPVTEFDFNALKEYKTSSQDAALASIAKEHGKKYVGSTSSMTSTLAHFHYLLSNWRDLNLSMLSQGFREDRKSFTQINRAPTAIFLRYKAGSKTYAIDADKEYDSGNVLMMLGKSMEKLLTMPKDAYERYRKSDARQIPLEEREAPEAFEYTTMGDFLMRSQLDAYDKRLPGQGMFDIKTRAVVSIRMQTTDYVPMLGYQIHTLQGHYESYEREYYDMLRSTMLKYMLQARMGRMDGIFLAYHNVQRIFGFQYLQMAEIDRAIHGQVDRCLGDQEFRVSLELLNKALDQATAKFPERSLRFYFETRVSPVTALYIFAEPMEDEQIDEIQSKSKSKIAEFEREMMGIEPEERPEVVKEAAEISATTSTAEGEGEAQPSPPTADDSPYHDSASPANQPFIDSIVPSADMAPLYAATIVCDSFVNGEYVDRPTRLRSEDDWHVEYLLKEMDPGMAWATYAQTKANRKKAFDSGEKKVEGEEGVEVEFNAFFEELKRLAKEGREFRGKMDGLERGRGKVVFREGEGVDEVDGGGETIPTEISRQDVSGQKTIENLSASADKEEVDGIESYMSWLYKRR